MAWRRLTGLQERRRSAVFPDPNLLRLFDPLLPIIEQSESRRRTRVEMRVKTPGDEG
jgi:hypothetical protein